LSGACSIALRCVHPFTGYAACSLWCGYRIVYCAIPDRDPSLINVSLFVSGTLSLFQSGVWHIHDHGTPLRCTFTAFVSVYPAQVVHPVLCFTSYARYRHIAFAPPVCIHIYRSSFYMFWWQPCGCIWWYSHMIASKLISLHCHHITPVLTICTAATVNSCFIVLLLPGACFLRHCHGSRLYNLFIFLLLCNIIQNLSHSKSK
jgi:hypothetical protein